MSNGALPLATYPYDPVRIGCRNCDRQGQYQRLRLVERFCADAAMPDVLRQLADRERWARFSDGCEAMYPDLAKR